MTSPRTVAVVQLARVFAAGLRAIAGGLDSFADLWAKADEAEARSHMPSAEARRIIGVGKTTMNRYIAEERCGRQGEPGGPFRKGNTWMVPTAAVDALLRGETYVHGVGEGDGEIAPQRAPESADGVLPLAPAARQTRSTRRRRRTGPRESLGSLAERLHAENGHGGTA